MKRRFFAEPTEPIQMSIPLDVFGVTGHLTEPKSFANLEADAHSACEPPAADAEVGGRQVF